MVITLVRLLNNKGKKSSWHIEESETITAGKELIKFNSGEKWIALKNWKAKQIVMHNDSDIQDYDA